MKFMYGALFYITIIGLTVLVIQIEKNTSDQKQEHISKIRYEAWVKETKNPNNLTYEEYKYTR